MWRGVVVAILAILVESFWFSLTEDDTRRQESNADARLINCMRTDRVVDWLRERNAGDAAVRCGMKKCRLWHRMEVSQRRKRVPADNEEDTLKKYVGLPTLFIITIG